MRRRYRRALAADDPKVMTTKEWLQKLAWWAGVFGVAALLHSRFEWSLVASIGTGVVTGVSLALLTGLVLDHA